MSKTLPTDDVFGIITHTATTAAPQETKAVTLSFPSSSSSSIDFTQNNNNNLSLSSSKSGHPKRRKRSKALFDGNSSNNHYNNTSSSSSSSIGNIKNNNNNNNDNNNNNNMTSTTTQAIMYRNGEYEGTLSPISHEPHGKLGIIKYGLSKKNTTKRGLLSTSSSKIVGGSGSNNSINGSDSTRHISDQSSTHSSSFSQQSSSGAVETYEGEWRNGKSHGTGVATTAKSGKYNGQWNRNHMHGSRGVYEFANGDVYDGEWRFSRFHGHGTFTWKSTGDEYVGQFVLGMREGQGQYTHKKSGVKFIGQWYSDQRHGLGQEIFTNQDRYEGYWIDGKRHGLGYFYRHMDNVDKKMKEERALLSKGNEMYVIYEHQYDKGKKVSDRELLPNEPVKDLASVIPNEMAPKLQIAPEFEKADVNNVFVRFLVYGDEVFPDSLKGDMPLDKAFVLMEKLASLKKVEEKREKLRTATKDLSARRAALLEKAQKLEDVKRDGTKQDMSKALRDICNTDPPGDGMLEDIFRMKLSVQISKLNEQMAAIDKMIENETSQSGLDGGVEEEGVEEWSDELQQQYDNIVSSINQQTSTIAKLEQDIMEDQSGTLVNYQSKDVIEYDLEPQFAEVVTAVCQFLALAQYQVRSSITPSAAKGRDLQKELQDIIDELRQGNDKLTVVAIRSIVDRMEDLLKLIDLYCN